MIKMREERTYSQENKNVLYPSTSQAKFSTNKIKERKQRDGIPSVQFQTPCWIRSKANGSNEKQRESERERAGEEEGGREGGRGLGKQTATEGESGGERKSWREPWRRGEKVVVVESGPSNQERKGVCVGVGGGMAGGSRRSEGGNSKRSSHCFSTTDRGRPPV